MDHVRVYGCSLSGVGSSSSLKAAGVAPNIILHRREAGAVHSFPTGEFDDSCSLHLGYKKLPPH